MGQLSDQLETSRRQDKTRQFCHDHGRGRPAETPQLLHGWKPPFCQAKAPATSEGSSQPLRENAPPGRAEPGQALLARTGREGGTALS